MIRQRLRGILGATITACVPWTALGIIVGIVLQLQLIPGMVIYLSSPIPGGTITACALAGALVGIINGLTFSTLILATERGKNVDELRPWRFAAWGAVATAGTLGIVFESLLVAGIGAGLGAVAAVAALWTARRTSVNPPAASAT